MQYPKDSTYSKKPCANHKFADCPNKLCGFNHALCIHYARNKCNRVDCAFPHRNPTKSMAVSNSTITPVSRQVGPVLNPRDMAYQVALTAEEEEFMLECELELIEDYDDIEDVYTSDDNCEYVEDENGVAIPLNVFYDDMMQIWGQILKDFGFESESHALNIFAHNYATNYGVSESDSKVNINQIRDVNPLILCEWILIGSEWDRESIDEYYINTLMSNDKSDLEAREIIGLFYKHYYGKTFGVNDETTHEA